MSTEMGGPQLVESFVELASWTELIEIIEVNQSALVVEFLQLVTALMLLIEKIEDLSSKGSVRGAIRRVTHGFRVEVTEEVLCMAFDEKQRIATGQEGQFEIDSLLVKIIHRRATADCSNESGSKPIAMIPFGMTTDVRQRVTLHAWIVKHTRVESTILILDVDIQELHT